MAGTTYKLRYFNLTGLGEPLRFLFHYGGIDFEDIRYERAEWPAIKSSMPFGQLPILEINDKIVNQNLAIARYIAKLVKLAGKDDLQDLEIDSMIDNITDLRLKIVQSWYEPDEALKAKKRETLVNETLPFNLEKFDNIVKSNKGYFVGGELTWADIYFAGLLYTFNFMMGFDIVEKYPNLQIVRDRVIELPGIKKYLAQRPKTEF